MRFMIANIWDKFSNWVTVEWSDLVFGIVVCVFAVIALESILTFLKKSNKDKKPFKWGSLILTLLCFGILAVLFAAKFA